MSKKATQKRPASPPRNVFHDHPLLRKCAEHGKSKKAQRRADRMALRRECPDQIVLH